MANWQVWEPSYRQLTLANDGDELEQDFAINYDLGKTFPNYESFWRYHVAPATNRPVDVDHRSTSDPLIQRLMELHHSVLADLYIAMRALPAMRRGEYGYREQYFKDSLILLCPSSPLVKASRG